MSFNITQARNKVRLEVGIEDLLVLAVLIENGGIFIRRYETLVLDDFKWIEESF